MHRSSPAALVIASLATAATLAAAAPSRAAILTFDAILNGASVSTPTPSPGTGLAIVTIDTAADTVEVNANFADLLGTDTAAHIHCCTSVADFGTAGVATPLPTFPGFPSGVTFGSYDHLFDLTQASSYNPAFVTAKGSVANAETALLTGIETGHAYFTIHTTAFPGGEIAGFFSPAAVPEPSTWAMALLGFGLVGASLRRRRTLTMA